MPATSTGYRPRREPALVLGYVGHNLALLAVPVVLAGAGACLEAVRRPSAALARVWSRGAECGVNLSQALNVWIIQIVVAIGPPLGGLISWSI